MFHLAERAFKFRQSSPNPFSPPPKILLMIEGLLAGGLLACSRKGWNTVTFH